MSLSIADSPSVNAWQSSSTANSQADLSGASALLAVLLQSQSSTQAGAKTDIELGAQKLEELRQQLADAVRHAQEAAQHSGFLGFLGKVFGSDIAKIVGAVAAIAATVASAGAATPLLLLAASAALQIGAKVGAELGLDPKLCMALSIAAVAVGFGSGSGASQISSVVRDIELVARVTEGSAVITGGVLQYEAARYHADDLNYQADAVGYHASQTATELSMDDAFALLDRALRREQRETSTVSEIIENNADTNATLSNRI